MIGFKPSNRASAEVPAGAPPAHPVAMVDSAVRSARGELAQAASHQGLAVSVSAMPGLAAEADQERLEELIGGVLSYAITTAPTSGHVALRCFRSDASINVLVEVADSPEARYQLAEGDVPGGVEQCPSELSAAEALAQQMGGRLESWTWPRIRRFTIVVPAAA